MSEMASYLSNNPSLAIGIDGHLDPSNRRLSEDRVLAVRDALIAYGVRPDRILIGPYGDPQLRRDRHVEVLLKTS
jgi:outer membrane protein OmpA-like peptidoglycan-associated protein